MTVVVDANEKGGRGNGGGAVVAPDPRAGSPLAASQTTDREASGAELENVGGSASTVCEAASGRHSASVAPANWTAPRSLAAVAVLSLLHEPPASSATRLFHGRPVLRHTLDRLARCVGIASVAILCWDDQAAAVGAAAGAGGDAGTEVLCQGPRRALRAMEAVSAARRWSDGWRGGLLGTCAFDAGFFGPAVREAVERAGGDAAVLIDPAAAVVGPALVDGLVRHAADHPDPELCFAPAAPGLGGVLLRKPLLDRLAAGGGAVAHPGQLLHYHPARVSREMLGGEACAAVPTPVARTVHSFLLSSRRQVRRLEAATAVGGGSLASAGAEEVVERVADLVRDGAAFDALPREVVLELTTARAARPVFWPGRYRDITRPPLTLELARQLFDELADLDDTRLTLAGAGDPLLAECVFDVVAAARSAGLAVHVETDLLDVSVEAVRRLAQTGIDVVSVHLPATTPQTYEAVMGADAYRRVLENIEIFVKERAARQSLVPLLVPLFVKCRQNLGEMEAWYDQWLRAVGSAVIVGPSEYAGLVRDVAAADMTPPRRRPCARLASRLTVLSDGRIVSCEQDVLGGQELGRIGKDRLADVWRDGFGELRRRHARREWGGCPACANCKEWHRP